MIAIVDYGAGNLTSVLRALRHLDHEAIITERPEDVAAADRVIFPGVGAAGATMQSLRQRRLDDALRKAAVEKPFLGICIGIQVIFQHSEENDTDCLGLLEGEVRRFSPSFGLKIPQIGWNAVNQEKPHPLFEGVPDGAEYYFVNSYFPGPADEGIVIGTTEYGTRFASAVASGNIVATQFHLEKSGPVGLKMLDNFCKWDGAA